MSSVCPTVTLPKLTEGGVTEILMRSTPMPVKGTSVVRLLNCPESVMVKVAGEETPAVVGENRTVTEVENVGRKPRKGKPLTIENGAERVEPLKLNSVKETFLIVIV